MLKGLFTRLRDEAIVIAVLLTVTAGLLIYEAYHTGVTADEPGHLVSARLYWEHKDRLRPQDMPPLIKIAGGWVPRLIQLPLPPDLGKPGEDRREWEVAINMMETLKPAAIHGLYFWSRIPLIIFPLLTILLVWRWARQIIGPFAACVAAVLFALEPTALAHGALFKNDQAATLTHLLFWFTVWRYWKDPSWKTALAVGTGAALALLSKLSLVFLVPLFPLLLIARLRRPRTLLWTGGAFALCYFLVLAGYQFDARPLSAAELSQAAGARYVPSLFAAGARIFGYIPMPASLWTGMITLFSNTAFEMPVYLAGQVWPHGNPLYFVRALLVKIPISVGVLLAIGLASVVMRACRRELEWKDLFWLIPGPLYIALASRVPFQLGVRLILPALPFGILLCAPAIEYLRQTRRRRAALVSLGLLFAFETIRIYPHGIAFFNIAAGGPSQGFQHLADSNLDWGQGLGDLAEFTRANGIPRIRLAYFGNDMMYRYFRGDEVEPLAPPWTEALVKSDRLTPEPGEWYAISPTLLPGQFFAPRFKGYYDAFRLLKPVARPGYSIFVYHIEAPLRDEARTVRDRISRN